MKATTAELRIDSLMVQYPNGVRALDGIGLEAGQGLFGLLGPNGAGKTTLMRTLATLQQPTAGKVKVCGLDVEAEAKEVRGILGYLPQDFQSYPQLSVGEVLEYYAILNGLSGSRARREKVGYLLDRVGLSAVARRKVGQLSGGMLRRVGVAQALLNDPKLLILDEPTAGLDPAERIRFRVFLGELSRERVVVLSTHIVPDISSSCEQLAVLDKGVLRFAGRRQELIAQAAGKVWRVLANDADYEYLSKTFPVTGMLETAQGIELRLLAAAPAGPGWEPLPANLEDAYLWALQAASN